MNNGDRSISPALLLGSEEEVDYYPFEWFGAFAMPEDAYTWIARKVYLTPEVYDYVHSTMKLATESATL